MRTTKILYTGEEYHLRLGIFLANARFVTEHNQKPGTPFRCSLNHLAALTPAEYKSMLGYRQPSHASNNRGVKMAPLRKNVPDSLDYRDKGVVNPVKDQAQCGSCWAFSAIQSIESTYALEKKTLYSLSEQNLVDCDLFCLGCSGGSMVTAFLFLIGWQSEYVATEANYPYTATDGACAYTEAKAVGPVLDTFGIVNPGDEESLKEGVATSGPHAVAIDASAVSFQLYKGGIYSEPACSSLQLDHGVGVIGYGTESGKDFWLVRNSWGAGWGEKGYIRMARNAGNMCGIASQASVPNPPS
jgi:cathepsin L